MIRTEKTAVTLAGMIIAAVYVIMLIGLTRSSYFLGGEALGRAGHAAEIVTLMRSIPPVPGGGALCTPVEIKAEQPEDCARAAQALNRLIDRAPPIAE